MCRWLAYSGSPVLIDEVLYKTQHSLIDQFLHARMGVETTNGDGFGLGWYAPDVETPAVFHSIEPAWNDRNLREVASHVHSPLFLAHIRASTGTAVQQTNCHPFRHGKWLWVHNGLVRDFHYVKRELALAVDESLYSAMEGSTSQASVGSLQGHLRRSPRGRRDGGQRKRRHRRVAALPEQTRNQLAGCGRTATVLQPGRYAPVRDGHRIASDTPKTP